MTRDCQCRFNSARSNTVILDHGSIVVLLSDTLHDRPLARDMLKWTSTGNREDSRSSHIGDKMLVKCTNCGIHFDPNLGQCISCGAEFAPSEDERESMLVPDAVSLLSAGRREKDVVQIIRKSGLSEQSARSVVSRAQFIRRGNAKSHGRHVVFSGIILLMGAGILHVLSLGLVTSVFWKMSIAAVVVGSGMIIFGVIKGRTGFTAFGDE